jgi:hypothetical protein
VFLRDGQPATSIKTALRNAMERTSIEGGRAGQHAFEANNTKRSNS